MKSSKSKKSLKNHRNPSKIHRNPSKIHRNPLKIRKSTKNIGSTWCNLFVKVLCHVKNGGQRKKSRKKIRKKSGKSEQIRKIQTNPENPIDFLFKNPLKIREKSTKSAKKSAGFLKIRKSRTLFWSEMPLALRMVLKQTL